ncbi:MAG TPA: AAA family ATPase [Deltaproteobacteria bacterium]|nr:AAA family ATPase [Deltaproteobacteria bacterium]HRW81339.1 AAA family ATPase [Desulfomonilia bacterium]HOA44523.1 AAA family ATPase [Deltaproteobacteria bacterium]HOG84442.1 AAA family ATPase [Deltaproteobacteria bacterium]HON94980.1 AAA family ATPase [Deltaproteobacteria bacterium]
MPDGDAPVRHESLFDSTGLGAYYTSMHITNVTLHPERYPSTELYPFNLQVFHTRRDLPFRKAITFFIGENGSGKSTLLKAIARRCSIHIWEEDRGRYGNNPHEEDLFKYLDVAWEDSRKPGMFFSSERYQHLAKIIDEWAISDPKLLEYFGGRSLLSQSHGESFMSYFTSRFAIEGIYFLDEPETALSPRRQIEFVKTLVEHTRDGHAQFIIATHSPILLSCPGAVIWSFDGHELKELAYEDTDYFLIYRDFLLHRERYMEGPSD